MPAARRSPLEGTDRLVIDGTNLLYRLGSGSAAPPAAVIGKLRAAIPATIAIDLVFDGIGHGVKGRLAQAMEVRYSGRHAADDTIMGLAEDSIRAGGGGPTAGAGVLVVTNDRELRARLDARGIRSVPIVWLTNRLDMPKLSSTAAGNRRPTLGGGQVAGTGIGGGAPGGPGGDVRDRPEVPGWKPGRGATTKTGPARKIARHKRHPRHGA
jgi:rRNA-processing protein FCF1